MSSLFKIVLNKLVRYLESFYICVIKQTSNMKFFRNNFVIRFLSLLSLCILLLNIVNKSLYIHSHQLENGEIVTHAHPFNQQDDDHPIKSHKHTSLEYLILSAFDIFTLSILLFTIVTFLVIFSNKIFFSKTLIKQLHFHYKQNKSPPILDSI